MVPMSHPRLSTKAGTGFVQLELKLKVLETEKDGAERALVAFGGGKKTFVLILSCGWTCLSMFQYS